jgi:hypothetical protein
MFKEEVCDWVDREKLTMYLFIMLHESQQQFRTISCNYVPREGSYDSAMIRGCLWTVLGRAELDKHR